MRHSNYLILFFCIIFFGVELEIQAQSLSFQVNDSVDFFLSDSVRKLNSDLGFYLGTKNKTDLIVVMKKSDSSSVVKTYRLKDKILLSVFNYKTIGYKKYLEGDFFTYVPEKKIHTKGSYKLNALDGEVKSYNDSTGKLISYQKCNYKTSECEIINYFERGNTMSEYTTIAGLNTGNYKEYYSNGKLKVVGNYKRIKMDDKNRLIYMKKINNYLEVNGYISIKDGKWLYYDENGKEIKTETFQEN
jgi:antitoxin component YwqK of YwqJK toxin-antitoxin module